jgi:hypothetical protein
LKFFRQINYTEKTKILYFLNLVYFLSLVGLWQNHVLYWTLTDFMWRHTTPFGKRMVNKLWVSMKLLSIFFPWNFTHVENNRAIYPCICTLYVYIALVQLWIFEVILWKFWILKKKMKFSIYKKKRKFSNLLKKNWTLNFSFF